MPIFQIQNNATGVPVIRVYGYIGNGDSIEVQAFMTAFDAATVGMDSVILEINCGGGNVIDGFAIIDLLKIRNKKIHCRVVGMAASMGFVLMLAGDTIEMMPNARLMTHRVSVGAGGDADQIRRMAELCESYENRIIEMCVTRTGQPLEAVKTWFATGIDKWFTAQEALALNIIDTITTVATPSEAAPQNSTAEATWQFYNSLILKNQSDMTNEELAAQLAAAQTENENLRAQLAAQNAVKVDELVNQAVTDGKIAEGAKPAFKALAEANYDHAKTVLENIAVSNIQNDNAPAADHAPLPARTAMREAIRNQAVDAPQAANRANWCYVDYAKNDPAALQNMTTPQIEVLLNRCPELPETKH